MTCAQPCWVEHWQLGAGWKGKGTAAQLLGENRGKTIASENKNADRT